MFRTIYNWLFGKKYSGVIDFSPELSEPTVQVVAETPIVTEKFSYPYKVSEFGVQLIKEREDLKLEAYPDGEGVWTIGYGQTGPDVVKGKKITKEKAEQLLSDFLTKQTSAMNVLMKDVKLVGQKQFDALSSLVYNIGVHAFKTSTILKLLKKSDWKNAAEQFVYIDKLGEYHGWIYDNGKKVKGLINRRIIEKEIFLKSSLGIE